MLGLPAEVLLLALARPAQAPGPAEARTAEAIELPAGPLRTTVRALDPEVAPAGLAGFGAPGRAPGLAAGALLDVSTWIRWRAAVRDLVRAGRVSGNGGAAAAALTPEVNARAHAVLALIAHEQGRWSDAWSHLSGAATEPALFAALLPRFVPGVAAGTALAPGGRPAALDEGAVLRPALPPSPSSTATPDDRKQALGVTDLQVGAGRVAFTLAVEHEGVQAEVRLASGTSARVALVLPRTEVYAVGAEYVDWNRQATIGAPLVLDLLPEEEPHVLFARFEPDDPRWPTRVPEILPAAVAARGLWIVLPPGDPDRAAWERIARAIALPEASIDCRLLAEKGPSEGGVTVDLSDHGTRSAKFAWLVSALERFVLGPR